MSYVTMSLLAALGLGVINGLRTWPLGTVEAKNINKSLTILTLKGIKDFILEPNVSDHGPGNHGSGFISHRTRL